MGFKQKSIFTKSGLSRRSSSPLNNLEGAADLANLDYTDTDFTADLNGKKIALQGEAIIPGKEVEKQATTPEEIEAWNEDEFTQLGSFVIVQPYVILKLDINQ